MEKGGTSLSRIIKQVAVYENDHIPSAILEILPQPLKRIIANAWSNYPNVEEIRLRKKACFPCFPWEDPVHPLNLLSN
jgi:hypothetical protein